MRENNGNGSRWWEFNLVRYFLGTLVGSFIVYLLFNHFVASLGGCEGEYSAIFNHLEALQGVEKVYNQLFYLGAGFIFCYFSSSPILVLHASRFQLKNYFKQGVIFSLALIFALITLVMCLQIKVYKCFSNEEVFVVCLLVYCFVLQCFLIQKIKNHEIINSYIRLTKNRETKSEKSSNSSTSESTQIGRWGQKPEPNGRETYVESYKHLREHGNAFFIVIFEIILGLMLYQIKTPELMIACIIIWILPGSMIWFFGNYLESDLT